MPLFVPKTVHKERSTVAARRPSSLTLLLAQQRRASCHSTTAFATATHTTSLEWRLLLTRSPILLPCILCTAISLARRTPLTACQVAAVLPIAANTATGFEGRLPRAGVARGPTLGLLAWLVCESTLHEVTHVGVLAGSCSTAETLSLRCSRFVCG